MTKPCCIVGEVAQAHDGSLGAAHAYIDAIAAAGAHAVKFQTHIAAAESTPQEPWRVPFSTQDANRYAYWKRMEFTEDQWRGLRQHAEERRLLFVSSPFSIEAALMLKRIGVAAWKVASGEVGNMPLLDCMADNGTPIWISTGLSPLKEIDTAVAQVAKRGVEHAVLQCTTQYPCPPEKIGFNLLPFFRDRYRCPVGLSDHSGTIYPGLAAVALGAEIVEVHVTLSRAAFGPDVAASVTTAELQQLVDGARWIHTGMTHPVDKDAMMRELQPVRELFTKSIVARMDLPPGTVLEPQHLAAKKPGNGLPAERLSAMIGRVLRRPLRTDQQLTEEDVER